MNTKKSLLIVIPLTILLTITLLVVFPTVIAHYQIMDFYDDNGYQPTWAKGLTVDKINERCEDESYLKDDAHWCLQFTIKLVAERIKGNI